MFDNVFTHDPLSADSVDFIISTTVDPGYTISDHDPRFEGIVYIDGSPKTYDDITWYWKHLYLINLFTSSEHIPTDVLPDLDTFPGLAVFGSKRFKARFYGGGESYFALYGEVTSLTVVPEPATILLLGLGGLVLLRKRKA